MRRKLNHLFREASGSNGGSPKVLVREGSVELRLVDLGDTEVMLQRNLMRRDGSIVVQLLAVSAPAQLVECWESDPYAEVLAQQYRAYLDIAAARGHVQGKRVPSSVTDCDTELDVLRLMRVVCLSRGGTSAIFHWISTTTSSTASRATYDTHVILAACPPGWLQQYVRRAVTDPVLEYARNENAPVRGSAILGELDRLMPASETGRHGLQSNVFFPANRGSDSGKVVGLLHVGSARAAPGGEDEIWQGQRELRGLAEELLDWPTIRFRRMAASYGLSDAERIILEWIRRGGNAKHAAADLSVTQRQIYRLYKSIKMKLGFDDIRACARMASDAGLLGLFK